MTDLSKLDIAIAEASEFLQKARSLRRPLYVYEHTKDIGEAQYPIDAAAKVRASSLRVYRAMIDLRRQEAKRL